MEFFVEVKLNDGKRESPGVKVFANSVPELIDILAEEICNDYDFIFGPGFTLHMERIS